MSARRANVSRSFFNRLIRNNSRIIANDLLGEDSDDSDHDVLIDRNEERNNIVQENVMLDGQNDVDNEDVLNLNNLVNIPEELFFDVNEEQDEEYDEEYDEDYDEEQVVDEEMDEEDIEFDMNEDGNSFIKKLARLVIKYRMTREATNELLRLLKEAGHNELPITRETLLHTPSTPIIPRHCYPGEYFHVGLRKCLKRCNFSFLENMETVELDINIDGLSIAKSSKLKMWPILGSFPNQLNISPFVIGAYVGYADPGSIEDFLKEYVEELLEILQNGAEVTRQLIRKRIRIRAYICDAPARAFLCSVLPHQAMLGCNKCEQRCIRTLEGKKAFLTTSGELRTDDSFRDRRQVEYHKEDFVQRLTPLEVLGTGMVSQVVNDPMHLIDEGVFAKIMECIFFGPFRSVYLQNNAKQLMDNIYISFSSYVPCEFERRTRSILNEFSRFKANEFRFWGLYGGFIQIKDYVGARAYQHFLKLFVAMRLLSCRSTHIINADYAEMLLQQFVAEYPTIFDDLVISIYIYWLVYTFNIFNVLGI